MSELKKIEIMCFTDILCIWAYIAQARMNQLLAKYVSSINIENHYISIFGSVESKLEKNWADKGGINAYCKHVQDIAKQYDHIEIHPDLWSKNRPTSSGNCHLFLKAIQLIESRETLAVPNISNGIFKKASDLMAWELRLAFFRDMLDISHTDSQMELAEKLQLPVSKIEHLIKNGSAHAELENDNQLKEKYAIKGSPSLVLNEGRQIIYGNVGYRVIEANIHELINQPDNQASWC